MLTWPAVAFGVSVAHPRDCIAQAPCWHDLCFSRTGGARAGSQGGRGGGGGGFGGVAAGAHTHQSHAWHVAAGLSPVRPAACVAAPPPLTPA